MKKKYLKIFLGAAMAYTVLFSAQSCKVRDDYPEFDPPVEEVPVKDTIPPDDIKTAWIQRIMDNTTYIKTFQMDTTQTIAPGFEYVHTRFINKENLSISMHILEIDMSKTKVTMQTLTPYNDYLFSAQHLPEMIPFNQVSAEGKIIAAINGDAATSNEPTGSYVKFGRVMKKNTSKTRPYIGVRKGSDKIEFFNSPDATKYPVPEIDYTQIKHLVGGSYFLLYKGNNVSTTSSGAARIAVGITQDESKIYLVATDGVVANFSAGVALDDLRDIMRALGCYTAMQPTSGNVTSLTVLDVLSKEQQWIKKNITPALAAAPSGIGFVVK
ncbi:hypothetical protein GCM10022216_07340 [Sphingobacterium kyonggiense]|uniref:Phosphodiester glycosidase domain-containing protein n=1 Tax=Sphingobacterium kyonggiense TaxID=714075 RepID=A0ABP7YFA9_9SPHI